jgi:hypothetical protein
MPTPCPARRWTLLLAAALGLAAPAVGSSQALGIAAYLALALLLFAESRRRSRAEGVSFLPLAAGVVLVSPDFHEWASGGLETSLFTALALAGMLRSRAVARSDRGAVATGALFSLLVPTPRGRRLHVRAACPARRAAAAGLARALAGEPRACAGAHRVRGGLRCRRRAAHPPLRRRHPAIRGVADERRFASERAIALRRLQADLVGLYAVAHTGVAIEDTALCVVGETVEGCLQIRIASRND